MKNNKIWIIAIVLILAIIIIPKLNLQLIITGSETMTRTASATVQPNQQFTVTYTAQGTSGTWGATIVDAVSGGCTFPAGTSLKSVLLSDEGTTKTIQVTAPSSGTCTFTGDYQFGSTSLKTFPNLVVSICQANTFADTDCNGQVSRTELGVAITNWVGGTVTRTQLGEAIMAWANS